MKQYECVCGKIFNDPQKFNGHKSNCKIHQQHKYGSLKEYNSPLAPNECDKMQQCLKYCAISDVGDAQSEDRVKIGS